MMLDTLTLVVDGRPVAADSGDLDPLTRAVIISLFTWRRARPDDLLPAGGDRQGWWGDGLAEIAGDQIGSRLWLLSRAKLTAETVAQARDHAEEALAWLRQDAVATAIAVTAERQGLDRLALGIVVSLPDGRRQSIGIGDIWGIIHG